MPLVTKVTVLTTDPALRSSCTRSTIESGASNNHSSSDPFTALCVEYSEPQAFSSRAVTADDAPNKIYMSRFALQEFNSSVEDPKCPDGMDAVKGDTGAFTYSPLRTFRFPDSEEASYAVLCLERTRAVVANTASGGTRIAASEFFSRVYVDEKEGRRVRLDIEQYKPFDWLARGDAKDERVVNMVFD